jgi:hypothetical protein
MKKVITAFMMVAKKYVTTDALNSGPKNNGQGNTGTKITKPQRMLLHDNAYKTKAVAIK